MKKDANGKVVEITAEEIWINICKEYHPDKHPGASEEMKQELHEIIVEAQEVYRQRKGQTLRRRG